LRWNDVPLAVYLPHPTLPPLAVSTSCSPSSSHRLSSSRNNQGITNQPTKSVTWGGPGPPMTSFLLAVPVRFAVFAPPTNSRFVLLPLPPRLGHCCVSFRPCPALPLYSPLIRYLFLFATRLMLIRRAHRPRTGPGLASIRSFYPFLFRRSTFHSCFR
jgi:hypothetical protein